VISALAVKPALVVADSTTVRRAIGDSTVNQRRTINRREHARIALPAMYTMVAAMPVSRADGSDLHGHAYDISEGGARIELDEPLPPGEAVNVRLTLPGHTGDIRAQADVVWVNDADDDPGPRRMALRFTDFVTSADRERLLRFVSTAVPRLAA
jgi:uncharacterized protein (TIGR02266 family)